MTTLRTRSTSTLPRAATAVMVCAMAAGCAMSSSTSPDFFHLGNFGRMLHGGDTAGRAPLAQLPQLPGNWGVGAMAGLKGEIVQIDGRLLVSPGSDDQGRVRAAAPAEQALLFASARVRAWVDVPVPVDMDAARLEAFVREQSLARGHSADQPFAFRVEGRFPRLRWHVVTGETTAGGHGGTHRANAGADGHANARAGMKVFHTPGAAGQLVGVYSGTALEGVITHPGERFHLHFVDATTTVSGHVDAYAVAAGAVLRLPRP